MFQEAVTFELEECYRKARGEQREERDQMLGAMKFMDSGSYEINGFRSGRISGSQKSHRRYLQTIASDHKER